MTDYHVYAIGNALVDMEFEVPENTLAKLSVDKGLMTLIDESRHHSLLESLSGIEGKRCSGGSAANTIIACAQLGGNTFYSCKVANDEAGDFYMRDLSACDVASNLGSADRDTGITGKCIVLVTPDAERSMSTYLGITDTFSATELDFDAAARATMLYIEGYLVAQPDACAAAIKVRQHAEAHGVQTALTVSDENMVRYFRQGLVDIIGSGLDLVFSNEDEARLMLNASTIEECVDGMKTLAKRFVITRGGQGAVLFDGSQLIEIPAHKVTPVDTNGAGDMYAGAFLYGLTHDMPFEQCGELASKAAATLITRFGARLSKDDMQAIKRDFNAT